MPRMSLKQAVRAAGVKRRPGSTLSRVARRSSFAFQAPRRAAPELKLIDTNIINPSSTTATITLVNGVAQGSDDVNRIGRRFTMKSIQWRGTALYGTTQATAQAVRVLMVYDKQANAAAPAITDILVSAATTALLNIDNRERFSILWDKVYPLQQTTLAPGAAHNIFNVSAYRKLSLMTTNIGTGATAASISTGALYFVYLGDVAVGAGTATPQLTSNVRVRFLDS